jgi:hypothetical protein
LASLTLGETAGYEHTLKVAHTGKTLDLVDNSLTALCGEVGCVIDCGYPMVVGEVVKQASFEETEHFTGLADDVGISVEFLAYIVRGEYAGVDIVCGQSMLVFTSER